MTTDERVERREMTQRMYEAVEERRDRAERQLRTIMAEEASVKA
jgi:hypothetical protein